VTSRVPVVAANAGTVLNASWLGIYRNNLVTHRIEPDPERAPIIVKLFEWYASGEYSLKVLTHKAAAAGLRTGRVVARW